MISPVVAETKINECIQIVSEKGFKLAAGKFGDEKRGCMFQALCLVMNDRKPGESVRELAGRHFEVAPPYIWAAVAGFDGKGPTHEVKVHQGLYEEWYDMGRRVAEQWRVHDKNQ